jgi:MFS family permease|tara:strand:- start:828 stop:1226 length:399 start_codon:yes stop_codon:yes gene_type:complete
MLSDRFGRATLTMFGCAIYAFFLFLLSAVNSYSLILLFLFFQGLGRAIWNISAWSFMSDIGERIHKEGEVVGSFMSISKAGGFVSFLFSGLIVQVYGVEKLFILNAFLIALGIIVASLYLDRNLPEKLSKDL